MLFKSTTQIFELLIKLDAPLTDDQFVIGLSSFFTCMHMCEAGLRNGCVHQSISMISRVMANH